MNQMNVLPLTEPRILLLKQTSPGEFLAPLQSASSESVILNAEQALEEQPHFRVVLNTSGNPTDKRTYYTSSGNNEPLVAVEDLPTTSTFVQGEIVEPIIFGVDSAEYANAVLRPVDVSYRSGATLDPAVQSQQPGASWLDNSQTTFPLFRPALRGGPQEEEDVYLEDLESLKAQLSQGEELVTLEVAPDAEKKRVVLRCETCDDAFDSIVVLRNHARKCRHSKKFTESLFSCERCGESFNQQTNFEVHSLTHQQPQKDGGWVCVVCDKRFGRVASFRCHVATVHTVDDLAVCEKCGEEFTFHSQLKKHFRLEHGEGEDPPGSRLCCLHCGLLLADEEEFRMHKENHKKIRETMRSVSVPKKKPSKKRGGSEHKCPHCSKVFRKKSALDRHIHIHTGAKPFSCGVCGKEFNQKGALTLHENTHAQNKPYTCQLCGAGFTQKGNLRKHVQRLHPSDLSSEKLAYSCPLCPCIFRSVQPLNVHVSKRHADKAEQRDERSQELDLSASLPVAIYAMEESSMDQELSKHPEEETQPPPQPAQTQPAPSTSATAEEKKGGTKTDGKTGKQLAVISQKLLKRATAELIKKKATAMIGDGLVGSGMAGGKVVWEDGKKRWECGRCGLRLSRCSDLVRHYRRHTGERPYECQYCHRSFSLNSTLQRHLGSHLGLKIHRCHICTKDMSNPSSLRRHLALHAAPSLPCPSCSRTFKTPVKLNLHLHRVHSEMEGGGRVADWKKGEGDGRRWEEPLREQDDGRVISVENVKDAPTNHKPSASRPFACSLCPAAYKHHRNLRFHQSTAHAGERGSAAGKSFFCCICHRGFLSARYLKEHLRRHSARRPFSCPNCPKTFVSSGHLKRHSVVHSDLQPFLCPYCMQRFKLGTRCRRHIRRMHQDKALPRPHQLISTEVVQEPLWVGPLPDYGYTEAHQLEPSIPPP